MKTVTQIIKENNINCEAALGRGKTSSGVLGSFKNESNSLGLTKEQVNLLNALGLINQKPAPSQK